MNAAQAAEKIGTDAKTLRRFIRSPKSTFGAVGSGARYEFDEKDIPTLRKKFNEWRDAGTTPKVKKDNNDSRPSVKKFKDADNPLPVSILKGRLTRTQRAQRDALSQARVDRLEAQLRATGKHISQYSNWGEKADV